MSDLGFKVKGAGGLHQNSLEIDLIIVSDRGVVKVIPLLLVPWKNIVQSHVLK